MYMNILRYDDDRVQSKKVSICVGECVCVCVLVFAC